MRTWSVSSIIQSVAMGSQASALTRKKPALAGGIAVKSQCAGYSRPGGVEITLQTIWLLKKAGLLQ
jgi:hypothetical protein